MIGMSDISRTVFFELRLKPNVGWWVDAFPEMDPDRITRPADFYYASETAARDACRRWAGSRFPEWGTSFHIGPNIPGA